MQVSNPNNIKIYNLSSGKALPEWLSEKKRRKLQKQDVDIRRRIELLQDFAMPHVSNIVEITKDSQYILACGTYKPRLRVYDTNQMSMKYEKCLDSSAIKMVTLDEDYSKLVIMQDNRYIEFHAKYGRFFQTRIPKYGRDMAYHQQSCDLYLTACGDEIYRLNLEQGKFLNSLKTNSTETLCCEFNPCHQLFTCGTAHGQVECWDPRTRFRVGVLDCALATYQDGDIDEVPKVTAVKYKDGLTLGVGTSTGQVLLYDIRANKPFLVKDHNYELPIRKILFQDKEDVVLSMDKKIVKIWDRNTGKAYTHIEPEGTTLNDMCMMPQTGLIFLANEAPKILSFYVPSLGPAPKWCSFLDNITEELEETNAPQVYDDYKFVTRQELEEMNLAHLIGTSLLRAYMHGFFMDIRLYGKAKSLTEPFAYDNYRKKKIRQHIEAERPDRVQAKTKLPTVNKELARKLLDSDNKKAGSLLADNRFSSLFTNPEFAIDKESHEFKNVQHNVSRLEEKAKSKRLVQQFEEVVIDTGELKPSNAHKKIMEEKPVTTGHKPKFFEIKSGDSLKDIRSGSRKTKKSKLTLEERIGQNPTDEVVIHNSGFGAKEMTFVTEKDSKADKRRQQNAQHHRDRAKIRRSAASITRHTMQPMKKRM